MPSGGWNGRFSLGDELDLSEESMGVWDNEKRKKVGWMEIDENGIISMYRDGETDPFVQVNFGSMGKNEKEKSESPGHL